MTVNIPLMRKVLEHIEAEVAAVTRYPDAFRAGDWNQRTWVKAPQSIPIPAGTPAITNSYGSIYYALDEMPCGTAMCFAGHVASITGATFAVAGVAQDSFTGSVEDRGYRSVDSIIDEDQQIVDIPEYARNQLGLTRRESEVLFRPTNNAQMLRDLCEQFAGCEL